MTYTKAQLVGMATLGVATVYRVCSIVQEKQAPVVPQVPVVKKIVYKTTINHYHFGDSSNSSSSQPAKDEGSSSGVEFVDDFVLFSCKEDSLNIFELMSNIFL